MRNECTELIVMEGSAEIARLTAYDVHSGSRHTKSWDGTVRGKVVELPNLKAVEVWARAAGFTIEKVREDHDALCSDNHGPSTPCIIR